MYAAKQKASDSASAVKERTDIFKAKAQEKAEIATARTKGEKEIIHERRKAKEAEANMKMHEAKAEHAQEKLLGKHHHKPAHHHQHQPIRGGAPVPAPAYPPGWVAPK
ncbi:hypothetical protein ACS0TY_022476 [Phlomoides rotata]